MAQSKQIPSDLQKPLRTNPDDARIQRLYFLKKLHKTPHAVRFIVSASGGLTEVISAFLDQILSPYIKHCPRVISNSLEVIQNHE